MASPPGARDSIIDEPIKEIIAKNIKFENSNKWAEHIGSRLPNLQTREKFNEEKAIRQRIEFLNQWIQDECINNMTPGGITFEHLQKRLKDWVKKEFVNEKVWKDLAQRNEPATGDKKLTDAMIKGVADLITVSGKLTDLANALGIKSYKVQGHAPPHRPIPEAAYAVLSEWVQSMDNRNEAYVTLRNALRTDKVALNEVATEEL